MGAWAPGFRHCCPVLKTTPQVKRAVHSSPAMLLLSRRLPQIMKLQSSAIFSSGKTTMAALRSGKIKVWSKEEHVGGCIERGYVKSDEAAEALRELRARYPDLERMKDADVKTFCKKLKLPVYFSKQDLLDVIKQISPPSTVY